jgi:membrane associated rhomboid family serine protease
VAFLLVDFYFMTHEWPIDLWGLLQFSALLAVSLALLFIARRRSWIRLDAEGVTRRGLLRKTYRRWPEFREFRRQYGEVELIGDGVRLPLSLDILQAGGTPMILRRGHLAFFSPPARLLLAWLPLKTPERNELPLVLTREERRRGIWWLAGVIALNAAVYYRESPGPGESFVEMLERLGARTGDWKHEPWRLFTSLLLHGSFFHLFFNMLMLAVLGPWMGRVFGWTKTWLLYLGSGVAGNLIGEILRRPGQHEPAVGASTAILGLLGALLNATYRYPDSVPLVARARFRWAIPVTLLLTLGMGLVIKVLDNDAHLGGFLAGFALAWPIAPRKTGSLAAESGVD